MMKNLLYLSFFICFICLSSCEKDELTLPSNVNLEFAMEPYHTETNTKTINSFDVNQGTITIASLEFDGRRDQGEDYFFTKQLDNALQAELHSGNVNQHLSFDIPQGVYKRIEFKFSLGTESDIAFCLQGNFQQGSLENIPVVFEYAFTENVRIRAKNREGNEQIVLKKDQPSTATVLVDVPFMFQIVNPGMIQLAETTMVEGNDIILINIEKNTEIFNLLATRLEKSIRVIFD
ncbi:MAG TPA: hypothetical protein VJ896_02670 [Bacteroidales bacterium]|nr:hypothetical protein [Bacteroidales bacterium]